MMPTPPSLLHRSLGAAKFAIVAALTFFAVHAGTHATSAGTAAVQEVATPLVGEARLEKLMVRHDCSTIGFGAGVIPGSSLVLREDRVRHLSFDEGWAVHTGSAPGTLLALCRSTLQR